MEASACIVINIIQHHLENIVRVVKLIIICLHCLWIKLFIVITKETIFFSIYKQDYMLLEIGNA